MDNFFRFTTLYIINITNIGRFSYLILKVFLDSSKHFFFLNMLEFTIIVFVIGT